MPLFDDVDFDIGHRHGRVASNIFYACAVERWSTGRLRRLRLRRLRLRLRLRRRY